jgi:hypothetical protein
MPERRKPNKIEEAASKATSIGPRHPLSRDLPKGAGTEADGVEAMMELMGFADNMMPGMGMVGGLPDGINPTAIREMLTRMGMEAAEEAPHIPTAAASSRNGVHKIKPAFEDFWESMMGRPDVQTKRRKLPLTKIEDPKK